VNLPPAIRGDFLHAFANALHGVFLWGMAVAALAFLLTWWLKEVPLRTETYAQTQLAAEEAAAGGTGSEALAGLRSEFVPRPTAIAYTRPATSSVSSRPVSPSVAPSTVVARAPAALANPAARSSGQPASLP
jgi:hypothetical protein